MKLGVTSDRQLRPVRRRHLLLTLQATIPFLCLLIVFGSGCTEQSPIKTLSIGHQPMFIDDASPNSLLQAVDRQIGYLQSRPTDSETVIDGYRFTVQTLLDSLQTFREIVALEPDPLARGRLIREQFHVFQAAGRTTDGQMLVTGYYEPLFRGSLIREGSFTHPLYEVPDSLVIRKNEQTGTKEIGRLDRGGILLPYWTRQEIETRDLLRGHELAYLNDPVDAYLMQVQGSGRILLPDGSIRALQFAAANGLPYNSLGKLFVDQGIMAKEQVSVPAIRAYFAAHPEHISSMLHHNPRYIFFRWGDDQGPRGALGLPLTPGRSVAIDHQVLPTGVVGYLLSKRPVLNEQGALSHWRPFGRFVLPQDSGSAIKGPGRVDIFWGADFYAETAAGHMNHQGTLFFLVKKSGAGFTSR